MLSTDPQSRVRAATRATAEAGSAGRERSRSVASGAPAGVEPALPRVRTGSSAELSYGAIDGCDRQGSNLRRLAFQASALPAELRSREVMGGAGVEPAASSVSERRSPA